ncbi:MAG: hypothetical protein MK207_11080 [Saprospiraceae bacterium]|nr:hypothetical protein [Saprospiraceae bacterium]
MTTFILIFFSYLFYQLLFKPAFLGSIHPNSDQKSKLMDQFEHLNQHRKTHQHHTTTKRKYTNSQKKGYSGGEYIDFEEL